MVAERQHLEDREQQLDDVVAAYLDAVECHGPQDPRRWLERYPELADELAEFFADEDQFGSLVAPLREVAQASSEALETPLQQHIRTPRLGDPMPQGAAPASLGDYDILEEIARGGMGV